MEPKIHENCNFTLDEIEKYLHSRKIPYEVTSEEVVEYWNRKNWLTQKGNKIENISAVINVVNSHVIQQKRKIGVIGVGNIIKDKDKNKEWKNHKSPYYEQLNDPKWKAYRDFIFIVRGSKCESCGKPSNLQIHHREYIANRFAWEYLPNEVMVLCGDCHRYIHKIKTKRL